MISLTDAAKQRVREILDTDTKSMLRVFVQGGGCSGFSYGFTLSTEQNEDDFITEDDNIKVAVDSMSLQYLHGSVIDYDDDIMSCSFVVKNPNAETTCGCGSSFSPGIL
jgi:iron-sulfur cluster insertion protein